MKCKNCRNLVYNKDNGTYPWCPIFDDSMDVEAERTCTEYETMSQADRIRNMNDEELANFLIKGRFNSLEIFDCYCFCPDAKRGCGFKCNHNEGNGKEVLIEWLKSEVKE